MTVYFLRDFANDRVKIGHTGNLPTRLRMLMRGRVDMAVVATLDGDQRLEDRLHALLNDDHVGGEWFAPTPAVLSVVGAAAWGLFDPSGLPEGVSPKRSAEAHGAWATRRARYGVHGTKRSAGARA
jgi:hypothetical protein